MSQKWLISVWQDTVSWTRFALRSSVAKNAASLYVIQFANYILPLIIVPYLVRVLGPEGFGLVAFGQSLIAYFALFVDYGFNLSATRKISVVRENIEIVSRVVFNVWAAKTLLCLVGMLILLLLINVVPKLREVWILLLILYGTVIGNVLFPIWLFQGMEKMVFISVINLFMKLFIVVGIFLMVRRPEDYLLYAGLMSLGSIGAGFTGAVVALSKFRLHLVLPSLRSVWEALREGWMLFLSMASVSLYTVGNAFILGLLTNPTVVGYYSAAEKIVKAILGLLGPLSQAAYPKFSKLASESKALALQWAWKMLFLMGGIGLILSLAILIGAPLITKILLGSGYEPSVAVMRILSITCFLIALSNVLGVLIMFTFHYEKGVFVRVLLAGVINISIAILAVPIWSANGMALAVVISETFVTVSYFAFMWKKGLNLKQWVRFRYE